jgi:aspartyl-tRNA(Asn)/glutamyl-tRNA(Gln) amidotransferase subunit C
MSLDHKKVHDIAHLARLEIKPEDVEGYASQLSRILNFVDQLNQINTESIEPMAHPLDMAQRLRPDLVSEANQRDRFQELAPAVSDGLYLVPKVIE